jgi:xanthine dehydrogenase accessory factor
VSVPDIWEEIVACRRRGEPAALATIVSALGSTPGKDPMKMLVRADGTFVGSVGGGCLEAEVWEHARNVMRTWRSMSVTFTLTEEHYPDSGLICGGTITVFIEPICAPALHIFGAGHVGRATACLAADAGFDVSLYDDREDMLQDDRLPAASRKRGGAYEQSAAQADIDDTAFVVVMTRGHHDDERVLAALSAASAKPRFLGMLGSASKRRTLLGRLAQQGVPRPWLDGIISPVGLPIGARTAQEIAVSIVAQLVAEVRGVDPSGDAGRGQQASGSHRRLTPLDDRK